MAKQQILLVDADSSSARLLEVSLRSAGFTVATADSAENAIAKLEHGTPDLIITDTRLPGADGFTFVRQLRARSESASVPVVFLTEQGALEDKLRGLELGVDDYLAKPIFVREVVTRVHLLLARKKQQRIAAEPTARTRFSGLLEDVAVVDLMQTINVSGKSGVASVRRGERQAWLYFDKGQVIDAEVGDLRGEEAVYRTITWTTGVFDVEFRAIERERVIEMSHQGLLMEGMRRVDELNRLAEQLPPETSIMDIDHEALASRLHEIPDELNGILRLIDGKRTLLDLIDASPFDDLSTLTVLSKFYFEGLLSSGNPDPVEWAPGSNRALLSSPPPANELGRPASDAARTSPPPSAAAPTQLPPTEPPPTRSPLTAPPSTVPATVDPPEDARRNTPPPPHAARPTMPAPVEGKLTPKGIVNVGEQTPPAPKAAPAALPSPFRVANDGPRRSPIPMPPPRGGTPTNGAHHGNGLYTNGKRESRTSMGLSAVGLHDRAPAPQPAEPEPVSPARVETPRAAAVRERALDAPGREAPAHAAVAPPIVAREPAPSAAPTRGQGGEAVARDPSARKTSAAAPTAGRSAPEGSGAASVVPSSHPEPEQEFFEAGDEGTYAGGPRSDVPVPRAVEAAVHEPAPRRAPAPAPARRVKSRHSVAIVATVLGAAAVLLAVGTWRRLSEPHPGEASPLVASEPAVLAPPDVTEPASAATSDPASTVAPPGSAAEPGSARAEPTVATEPAPPSSVDSPAATPSAATAPGGAAAAAVAAPVAVPSAAAHAVAAPARAPSPAAAPRAARTPPSPPPAVNRPAAAPPPSPPPAAALPPTGAGKGLTVPMPPMVPKGPKEKPPTAAYPIH